MLAMRMSGSRGGRRPGPFTPRCDCALAEADQFPALALPCIDGYREIGLQPLPIAIAAKQLMVRPGEMRFPGIGGAIDRKSTRLNSSHYCASRLPSFAFIKNKYLT